VLSYSPIDVLEVGFHFRANPVYIYGHNKVLLNKDSMHERPPGVNIQIHPQTRTHNALPATRRKFISFFFNCFVFNILAFPIHLHRVYKRAVINETAKRAKKRKGNKQAEYLLSDSR